MTDGCEWVVDARGCDPTRVADRATLERLFARIIDELRLTPVADAVWHVFPPPGGVTGLVPLAESHLTIHTFPEHGSLPPATSAIQLGTEGRYKGTPFTVVGRILYAYDRGRWNEWHLRLADDTSAWLSDALAEYGVSRQLEQHPPLPKANDLNVGQ